MIGRMRPSPAHPSHRCTRTAVPAAGARLPLTLLSVSLALAAWDSMSPVHAQSQTPAPAAAPQPAVSELAPVAVTGLVDPLRTEDTGSYTASALSLGKTNTSLRDTPHSVTVISRQRMEDQGLWDMAEVLQNTPGIEVSYTDSERPSYFSRGYEIDTIQYDGGNSAVPGSGSGQFIAPDMAVFDHVEVLRGAAGLMRGAGSPSGAINLVRKRPTRSFMGSASATVGSWDTYRVEGDLSGPLAASGALRGRMVVVEDKRGHFQSARQSEKRVFYGIVEADLGARTRVYGGLEYNDYDTTGAWGNLMALDDGSPREFSRDTYLGASWNRWNRTNLQGFLGLEHTWDNGWALRATANVTEMKRKTDGHRQTLISRNPTNPDLINYQVTGCFNEGYSARQNSWDINATGPFALLGREHELVVGANGSRDASAPSVCANVRGLPSMNGIDPYAWNPFDIPEPAITAPGGPYSINTTVQQGVYSTLRLSVTDALKVVTGARMSWWDYQPQQRQNGYSVDAELTPYVGAIYALNDNLSVYASAADIFTPQRAFDTAGVMLKPMTGRNLELGVKGAFHGGRLNVSAAIFKLEQTGKALDDLSTDDPCLPYYTSGYCKVADGKTRSQGVDTEISGMLLPGWQISGGYTFNTTKVIADSGAATGILVRSTTPKHLLRVFTSYALPGDLNRWTLGGGINVQSAISSRSGDALATQSGYALASAFVRYRVSDQLTAQVNINNLFDRTYYSKIRPTGPGYYYGEPRSVMLTLRGKF